QKRNFAAHQPALLEFRLDELRSSLALVSDAGIRSYHQRASIQPLDEDILNKILGAHSGKGTREMNRMKDIDAELAQQPKRLPYRRDARKFRRLAKDDSRMRIE